MAANQECREDGETIAAGTEHRSGLILGGTRTDAGLAHSSTLVRASQSLAARDAAMLVHGARQEVTVWSNNIHWPQVCACCLGEPDCTTEISHVTTTDLASAPKRFDSATIPCCSSCLWHARVCRQLRKLAMRPTLNVSLAISGMVTIAGALVASLAGDHDIIGLGVAILSVSSIIFLSIAAARAEAVRHNNVVTRKRNALEEELQKALSPTCCGADCAIEFTQKDGAIHSFVFQSADYAERFRQLNADSLLEARRRSAGEMV